MFQEVVAHHMGSFSRTLPHFSNPTITHPMSSRDSCTGHMLLFIRYSVTNNTPYCKFHVVFSLRVRESVAVVSHLGMYCGLSHIRFASV